MNILWLCNDMPQYVADRMPEPRRNSAVTWLTDITARIVQSPDVKLTVCFPVRHGIKSGHGSVENISYYTFHAASRPEKYDDALEAVFGTLLSEVKPDIVHVWGTEYPHTLAMMRACAKLGITDRAAVSIQGLCSVYAGHYALGLPDWVIRSINFRHIIRRDGIAGQIRAYRLRGDNEVAALKLCKNVIGRTDWDRTCAEMITPDARYFVNNETMRPPFYKSGWSQDKCTSHRIFMSQAYYPIKGLHFMLEALRIIRERYPDVTLHCAGDDVFTRDTLKKKIAATSYTKYICELLDEYLLRDCVTFTGYLDEDAMASEYLAANVFVSPSAIENSPNSLCEAMLLGTPCVSSDVGGVKTLLRHGIDGFIYACDEPYMLADCVCRIFADASLAEGFSKSASEEAHKRHEPCKNAAELLEIYDRIRQPVMS